MSERSNERRRSLWCLLPLLAVVVSGPARAVERMTYAEAKARIPNRELPGFWIGDVRSLDQRFGELNAGQVQVIATTPGGRPVHLIAYGNREPVAHKANFNSAIGAREPNAYMDKVARDTPVVLFVGPVHGHEVEALTGLVSLVHVMETGRDLRDKPQQQLRQLGRQCRLLIVPEGNPDGIARFEPRALQGMGRDDIRFWGQGTWSDHTLCGWPQVKRQHPLLGDNVGFVGCYFNEAGINPMHDEFFFPMGPEAPAILRVAQAEGPDLAVSLHSHENKPALLRPAYVPMETQEDVRALAKRCYALLAERGLPHGGLFESSAEGGPRPSPFNLTSALYHVCGASAFTFECPHGTEDGCQVTLEQILEIQLTLYEAMLEHEIAKKR